ncbi:serine hydrolase domain-containing protein [Chryseobacterium camelliae]|uniref:serine hydrolase domain-containing protein n=1 Tax=Chryseobacterium camelliae TaxID=1265445 RepID=UPI00285FD561|nr:serine hydrolase domain-containing protein [Chryseobacterium camelliae]MDR6516872.1 D-alanyl-D-alanine carboxypeptidase [Chryseobacterium camelliae]
MRKVYLICILNFFGILSAQNHDYKRSIDSLLNYLQEKNAFSGTVLIQKNGGTVYSGDFNKFPSGSDQYRIGSITKIFTAIITFQLLEEGKISLSANLNRFFPDIKNSDKITIGNMLNHTSGIYDYLQWEDYYSKKNNALSKNGLLKLITSGKPDFKPGEDISYSNSNYILLGYIIESLTGKSFEENLKHRIINKLDLKNTYYETSVNQYTQRNISYLYDGERWLKETDTHPSLTLSAGAIVSTPEDVAKMIHALFNGKLVSPETLAQMEKGNAKALGYGLQITPFYKNMGYGHTGRVDEFHSFVGYFPEDRLSMVVFSNGNTIKLNTIAIGILSKYYQKKYIHPDFPEYESKISPSMDKFAGIYHAKLAGVITVARFQISKAGKNHLFLSMYNNGKEGEKRLLIRKNENTFYSPENNAEFDFTLNKKGEIKGAKLTQGQQSINCTKTS